ncbi:P2Y purinoceptor 1-like [Rhincodon typus]|uniref:P2Y purinoceptor 1-like n=1 Tax=Rhincodon typus TaxID=259920 RepID=UPI0009A3C317|nr:P2Y purinoceptor 1-like [Rhincodon typus]
MAELSTIFPSGPFTSLEPGNRTYCNVNKDFTAKFLPTVYTIVFIMGFLGNCWVLGDMCLSRRKCTNITVFLFNLGLADLLYVISLPFLVVYYASERYWMFGKAFCRITRLLFHLNLYGSIGFLTCISVQRYLGIVHPMKVLGRWNRRHSLLISLLVWGLVLTQTSADLHFTKTNLNGTKCYDSVTTKELKQYIKYNLALSVIAFFIPFLIIVGCYSHVVLVLIRNNNVDQGLRDRCLKLVLIMTVLFSLCFAPYHVLRNANLISRYFQLQGQCIQTFKNIYLGYQVARAMASLNSIINPLVYVLAGDNMKS